MATAGFSSVRKLPMKGLSVNDGLESDSEAAPPARAAIPLQSNRRGSHIGLAVAVLFCIVCWSVMWAVHATYRPAKDRRVPFGFVGTTKVPRDPSKTAAEWRHAQQEATWMDWQISNLPGVVGPVIIVDGAGWAPQVGTGGFLHVYEDRIELGSPRALSVVPTQFRTFQKSAKTVGYLNESPSWPTRFLLH